MELSSGREHEDCALTYAGATVSGMIAGMRSMAAPALINHMGLSDLLPPHSGPLTATLAVGEMVADKLPFLPKRTMAGPLIARAVSGGFSGGSIGKARRCSPWLGAALGAAAAIGTTYAMHELRKEVGERFRIPDFLVALAEDALLAGLAAGLLARFGSSLHGEQSAHRELPARDLTT